MTGRNFYTNLPSVTNFMDLARLDHYKHVPDDWYVLITDITGSTQKIEAGQYREVNMLGASSIMAVLNAVHPVEVPFVFGGDGASLIVPPCCLDEAREALLGVRAVAAQAFDMDLRVGAVPVAKIRHPYSLRVAKLKLAPHYHQASFIGGGITHASDLVKQNSIYRLDLDRDSGNANLTGLECRWQEVPSPRGETVSLIVNAVDTQGEAVSQIYQDILEAIRRIYGEPDDYHPISELNLHLSFNPYKLAAEVKARSRTNLWSRLKYWVRLLIENVLGTVFMGLDLSIGGVDWGKYRDDVRAASDYRKIDDTLRMVISGSPAQNRRLVRYLEKHFCTGKITYGLHTSTHTVLTCLILDRRDCHFHLIDGAGGGYAMAAKALKSCQHRAHQCA